MEFNNKLEMKLRNALKAKNQKSFYFISKPETSKEIWNITAATLTAIEYKYPEKQKEISTFLEKIFRTFNVRIKTRIQIRQ